jgi:hypothetical protein
MELVRSENYDIVKLDARTGALGVAAERGWIRHMYPGSTLVLQALSDRPVPFDLIRIKLANGSTKDIHFDISSFFPGDPAPAAVSYNSAIQEIISRYQ